MVQMKKKLQRICHRAEKHLALKYFEVFTYLERHSQILQAIVLKEPQKLSVTLQKAIFLIYSRKPDFSSACNSNIKSCISSNTPLAVNRLECPCGSFYFDNTKHKLKVDWLNPKMLSWQSTLFNGIALQQSKPCFGS